MAGPEKDRTLSKVKIVELYRGMGLSKALRTQGIAGNESGDRELPPATDRTVTERRKVILGVDQGRGRAQGDIQQIRLDGHG